MTGDTVLRATVLSLLALAASHPACAQDLATASGSVFATVAQSEWCPTGTVFVDLATGRYLSTPAVGRRTCYDPELERPVDDGALSEQQLAAVRAAYNDAVRDGLTVPECLDGGGAPRLVVSNGGPQVLVVTAGPYTLVARENLGCWTGAAERLHGVLDEMFRPGTSRPPRD